MNILITGGSGFIGTSLCRRLSKAGHKVISLDLYNSPLSQVKTFKLDITDPKLKERKFWRKIDVCYHLAAMANVDDCRVLRDKAFMVNLYGTYNIAEACRRNNILMIMASTACCYGNTSQHPSTEDGPTQPCDLYGVTKRAGEELVKLLSRWVILRFGTTIGPDMRSALATWIFLNQTHNGETLTISGDGKQSRNWIYVEDLVEGCYKVIEKGVENEVINLVGKKSYTVNQMAKLCAEIVLGRRKAYKIKYIPAREGDVFKEDISIEKAKRLLGWTPKVDLKQALKLSYKKAFK